MTASLARAFAEGGFLGLLGLAILPLVVALPLAAGVSIVVGLPLTAALRRQGRESAAAYVILGASTGASLMLVTVFPGAVTGRTWCTSACVSEAGR